MISRLQPRPRGNTVLGVLIGLGIGLVIAGISAWVVLRSPAPFKERVETEPAKAKAAAVAAPATKPADPPPAEPKATPQVETKPEPKVEAKPPEPPKSATPEAPPKPPPAAPAPAQDKAAAKPALFVQVGAFANRDEAANQRGRLALLGLEAAISPVQVGEQTLYRVRLGPFADPDEAARSRAELAKNGIEAVVSKP